MPDSPFPTGETLYQRVQGFSQLIQVRTRLTGLLTLEQWFSTWGVATLGGHMSGIRISSNIYIMIHNGSKTYSYEVTIKIILRSGVTTTRKAAALVF